jgi:hypothetical protein
MAETVEAASSPDTLHLAPVFVPVVPPDVDAER